MGHENLPISHDIVNSIFKEPEMWNTLPILKKCRDIFSTNNYKGIVSNTIEKLVESVLKNRLEFFFDERQN